MSVDFSTIPINTIVWVVVVIVAVVIGLVVIRFFWKHVLKYLLQGCLVILAILFVLAVLHYFKVF
jgi:hypothetical protein